ncbi:MAG: hypothetical protein ACOY0S_01455 [Patescibacteria group bacterium]
MAKTKLLYALLAVFLVGGSFLIYRAVVAPQAPPQTAQEEPVESLPPADTSVIVEASKSRSKDNTVVLSVKGLASKYASVAYELTYESQGLIKGVNSGSRPIDVSGKDSFEREVYLGTCSRNVCKPDLGVKKVSVALEFTDTAGKRSQFSKEFEL